MKRIFYLFYTVVFVSCSNNSTNEVAVVNQFENNLKPKFNMVEKELKHFKLDSTTAPVPRYMSLIYNDSTKKQELTFFNDFTHTIQFYDYDSLKLIKKIKFDKDGSNGIVKPAGYFIKNRDSIYIYDMYRLELCLTNGKGQLLNKKSLIGNLDVKKDPWMYKYPQNHPSTVTPVLGIDDELIIMGQSMQDIQDTIIDKFRYLSYVNKKLNQSKVMYKYPKKLYGNNYLWGDPLFTEVFYDVVIKDKGKSKIIFSYPVSHDIYLSDGLKEQNVVKKYAGSNYAGVISSLDFKKGKSIMPSELRANYIKNDLYGAILYDKYRKVYYRFLRRGVKEAENKFDLKDKPIAVIIYDDKFNYLGETDLGLAKVCHWENSFVSKEGLNIEWIDPRDVDETYLKLKIFVLKEI